MEERMYANLIRKAARESDEDVSDLNDTDLIYYYENTFWGRVHQMKVIIEEIGSQMSKVWRNYCEGRGKEDGS